MSLSPKDEKRLFKAQKLARDVMSRVTQGFAAAGSAALQLKPEDAKLAEKIVRRVLGEVNVRVKEARSDGASSVDLYEYDLDPHTSMRDSGANISTHRAACEMLMAAINANPELHAWVEWFEEEHHLMLDFSRLHARSLEANVVLDASPSD